MIAHNTAVVLINDRVCAIAYVTININRDSYLTPLFHDMIAYIENDFVAHDDVIALIRNLKLTGATRKAIMSNERKVETHAVLGINLCKIGLWKNEHECIEQYWEYIM